MAYGVTPTGFVPKTTEILKQEIEATEQGSIDANLYVGAESLIGAVNAVMVPKLRELWELAAAVNDARDPRNATGQQLVAAAALTGTAPRPAQKGSVSLTLSVAAHSTVAAGAVAAITGQPANQWITETDAVNATGSTADVVVTALAALPGIYPANSGTITTIATPVAGWLGVTNPSDAAPGRGPETDPELRLRRAQELSHGGGTALESIRTTLLELKSSAGNLIFQSVIVDENASNYTDALGRPPHTIEIVIRPAPGASDPGAQALAELTMWITKPGGIATFGSQSGTVIDSTGTARTVRYSIAASVPVWVSVIAAIDPTTYAGDADLKTAIAAWGNAKMMGDDVVLAKLEGFIVNYPGINDIGFLELSLNGTSWFARNVTIDARSVASFDTAHISVTSA